jgi:hypothetical protein
MYRATPDQLQHLLHSSNLERSEPNAAPARGSKKVPVSRPSLSTQILFPGCLAPRLAHRVMDIPLDPAIAEEVVGGRLYMDKGIDTGHQGQEYRMVSMAQCRINAGSLPISGKPTSRDARC